MPDRLFCILRDKLLKFEALAGSCSGRPTRVRAEVAARSAQLLDPLISTTLTASKPRSRRFDTKEGRGLTGLDTPPELSFGGQKKMLVERVGAQT